MKNTTPFYFKIFAGLLITLLFASRIQAQESIEVKEQSKSFSRGSFTAFTMEVPQANWRTVLSDWKTFLKQQSKKSVSDKNGEIFLAKCLIGRLGADSIAVYSTVVSQPERILISAFYFVDDSLPINSTTYTEKAGSIKVFMREFGVKEYQLAVEHELADAMKVQKNLENNVEKIENENESLLKKINENNRNTSRKRDDITANEQEQKLKSDAILQQKTLLMNFNGTLDAREKEEKKLSALEKEKKKLQKGNESLHEKIDDNESENRSFQKKIDKNNDENIPAAKAAVNSQKNQIAQIQDKLSKIK